jgi:hypothetical protein
MKRKPEEPNPKNIEAKEGPLWKEPEILFVILFFPGILLLCAFCYWITVFILKK